MEPRRLIEAVQKRKTGEGESRMKLARTLAFTGVWFWCGLACMAVAAYGIANEAPSHNQNIADSAVAFGSVFDDSIGRYVYRIVGLLGVAYVLYGWMKARNDALAG